MSNLIDYFHEAAIESGIGTIIRDEFGLKLEPKQMEHLTSLIMDKLGHMIETSDEDMEVSMFRYLLQTIIHNVTLEAKIKTLEEGSG